MYDRRTRIVATIGPACQDESTLEKLILAGVNVARLNFSHGAHADHAAVIARIRAISNRTGIPVAVLQDLQGPKVRTGAVAAGEATLVPGHELILTTRNVPGDEHIIAVDFPGLHRVVQPGNRILLDDGNLELTVVAVRDEEITTRVILGGILKSHKGINLPGAALEIPGFTEKDREDLLFGLDQGVDLVAISFVRTAADVHAVLKFIQEQTPPERRPPVIAKLERPEALQNLEEIILAADGVMVARGDLGVELPPEQVPIAQKQIIACANQHARLVITATQMLDSMIHNPRPTRAETSDVANAIFDGTDAVMLSGETAAGKYPVQSVEMMNAIICQAETHMTDWGHWQGNALPETGEDDSFYLTLAARELAHDRNVAAIAVFTQSGRTARLMSKVRPVVPILAFTPHAHICSRMSAFWGVHPLVVPHANTIEEMLAAVESTMVSSTGIQPGQQVVLICGFPVHAIRPTNLALLHTVGENH